jgi:hypothetical protein
VIRVALFVIAGVGDPAAVGRDLRVAVRALSVGKGFYVERAQIDRVDLAVSAKVFRLRFSDRRDIKSLAV